MADNTDTMVLRSFHLPQSTDDEMRGLAFSLRAAKADLLRYFIDQGMTSLAERYGDWQSWDRSVIDEVAHAVRAGGGSAAVKEGIRGDIHRLGSLADEAGAERAGLDNLLSQIPTGGIASEIGAAETDVDHAVQFLVPVLVGGLQVNAQDPKTARKIESAAASQAGLLDGGVTVDQVDEKAGEKAIGRVFGGNSAAQLADALAGGSDSSELLEQVLPFVAPIVLGYIGKQITGVTGEPATKAAGSAALNDVLSSIIDELPGPSKSMSTVLGKALGPRPGDVTVGRSKSRA